MSVWRRSWSCDLDHFIKVSFNYPVQAQHEIWLQLAQRFLRKSSYIQSDIPLTKVTKLPWTLTYIVVSCTPYLTASTNSHIIDYNTLVLSLSFKSLQDQIWLCCKNGPWSTQSHHFSKFDDIQVPDAAYQVSSALAHLYWRRRFLKVFTIYGHGGHLGHVTGTIWINSPLPLKFHSILPNGFYRRSPFESADGQRWRRKTDEVGFSSLYWEVSYSFFYFVW